MAASPAAGLTVESVEKLDNAANGKRPRVDPIEEEELRSCGSTLDGDFVRRSELEKLLGGFTEKIIADNLAAGKAGAASVGANMGEMLRAFDGMQQTRFN